MFFNSRYRRVAELELLERREVLDGSATSAFVPELVADLGLSRPYDLDGYLNDIAWLDDEVVFAADDGSGDVELWKSDGTAAGTVRVKDLQTGERSSLPKHFVAGSGMVLFTEGIIRNASDAK